MMLRFLTKNNNFFENILSKKILKELEIFLTKSNNQKSSHWASHLDNNNFYDIEKSIGFGGFAKKKFLRGAFHLFFQKIVFENYIFKTKEYKIYKNLCDLQKRFIESDVIRHIFTLNLLNKYNLIDNKICVIGDGKSNFIGGLLLSKINNIKIFSINLSEVLIHDYLLIRSGNLIDDENIQVVKNKKDLNKKNKKLFLIDASNSDFLINNNINLFVNIASMQEMRNDIIENYFRIIKSNNSFFYCCNRELKKLVGGEELNIKIYEN